jgi:beta-galactosidase
LTPGQSAVYRTEFEAGADMLASPSANISFGMLDDAGWVSVNGQLAGESHDWAGHPSFTLRKFLREGKNTIAVAVQNVANSGGVNKGVSLEIEGKPVPAQWKRSVFNGLAQIIVQAGKEPGTIALTARADGMASTGLNISASTAVPRPGVP